MLSDSPHPVSVLPAGDGTREATIVYFDGTCGLCSHTVDFLLRHDRRRALRFAPLQGATALQHLPQEDRESLKSLVVTYQRQILRRSTAVVRVLSELAGWWRALAWILWLVPLPLRDIGYRVVARYRYSFFGRKEVCRIPTGEEAAQILP